jgi:hypothetical protein
VVCGQDSHEEGETKSKEKAARKKVAGETKSKDIETKSKEKAAHKKVGLQV